MNQKSEAGGLSDSGLQKEIVFSKVESKSKTKSNTNTMAALANTKMRAKTRRPNGRLVKRKTRKNTRIKGLEAIDFLHNKTLLSTALKGCGQKSPPPPGCVDYQFTALTTMAADTLPIHTELPPATYDTPYALQVLLDMYREQFLAMIRCMKSEDFRKNVEVQIIDEKEKKQKLTAKLEQLEKQINLLISDSLKLLRTRMAELGITNGYNTKDLITKAKEIMSHHHELHGEAVDLNYQIPVLEGENMQFLNESAEEDEIPISKFQIPANITTLTDNSSIYGPSLEIPSCQVKSEPLDNYDNVSSSELQRRLNVFNCNNESQAVEPSETDFNVTPCSIVLPRIPNVTKPRLLTPAQKKFACHEFQISTDVRDPTTDISALNNENKPPSEKHYSRHKHRHKKSHKSKRKHKHHDTVDQHDLNVMKSTKSEPFVSPSCPKLITDPIEEIITRTLNDSSVRPYTSRAPSAVTAPVTNLINFGIMNGGVSDKTDHSDYRRVPPMKIALKKFAQENNCFQGTSSTSMTSMMRTTVGDLVSSEIEKSLEISNRIVNQSSVPLDYNSVNNRQMLKRSSSEQNEMRGGGSREQSVSRSPYLTPAYIMPSPSYMSSKNNSPRFREEPFEGLAASMLGAVNSCRSSEADSSRHSSPYCTPPMNLEFKIEPNTDSEYLCSSSHPAARLSNEPGSSVDHKNHADSNKWQEVSLCFDRVFEFVSNKIDSQENVPTKDKFRCKLKDSSTTDKHSPTFALNPPPLFRADSSYVNSPPMPDLPVSPASLEGPFSPVPSLSPPALSSPVSTTNMENKDEHSTYNEKFRPKGKGWKWPSL